MENEQIKILTPEQFQYIQTCHMQGETSAKEEVTKRITASLKEKLSNLPEGAETDSYISKLANIQVVEFKNAYNEALLGLHWNRNSVKK